MKSGFSCSLNYVTNLHITSCVMKDSPLSLRGKTNMGISGGGYWLNNHSVQQLVVRIKPHSDDKCY